jgi:glutaredoxin
VKEFLSRKGVPYQEFNIRKDSSALQELLALRSNATPTVVIDGEVIIGFDAKRLEALLA